MPRFTPPVEAVLRQAGWHPDRRVDLTRWKASLTEFPWHPAAERFLGEFGGLRVDVRGPGITVAREPFELDPELAAGEEERFADLSAAFGCAFFPVGELGQGEFFLGIDEEGAVYLLAARAFRHGPADAALEHLVTGVAPQRVAPPGGKP